MQHPPTHMHSPHTLLILQRNTHTCTRAPHRLRHLRGDDHLARGPAVEGRGAHAGLRRLSGEELRGRGVESTRRLRTANARP